MPAYADTPYSMGWVQLFGTEGADYGQDLAVDGLGNIYFTGSTAGALDGNDWAGDNDIFLARLNASGEKVWTEQFGTVYNNQAFAAAVDSTGHAYLTGVTSQGLDGEPELGFNDAFLTRYDPSGQRLWTRSIGSDGHDRGRNLAVDAQDNVLVLGYAGDTMVGAGASSNFPNAFLAKYDSGGNQVWAQAFDPAGQLTPSGLTVDAAGNIYITGGSRDSFGDYTHQGDGDALLRMYDPMGNELWTRQFGTADPDGAGQVVIDGSGDIVLLGSTFGEIDGNPTTFGANAFVMKLGSDGETRWVHVIGPDSPYSDARDLVLDDAGNVFIAGSSAEPLAGDDVYGSGGSFLMQLDADGNHAWTQLFSTGGRTDTMAMDDAGNIYLGGYGLEELDPERWAGNADAFVMQFLASALEIGDVDGDGWVGAADLDLVLAEWGMAGSAADLDGSGTVGRGDLDLVIANWGNGDPPAGVVPEPGGVALLGLGGLLIARRRR